MAEPNRLAFDMSRLSQLEKLHAAEPNDADIVYMIAHEHAKSGNLPLAVQWYDRCLAMDETYHYAYFHKAKAQQGAGEFDRARDTARAGLERAKKDACAKATNELGSLLMELES